MAFSVKKASSLIMIRNDSKHLKNYLKLVTGDIFVLTIGKDTKGGKNTNELLHYLLIS